MTTAALRQAALLDPWGMLIPDGTIGDEDRVALLGQYPVQSSGVFIRTHSRRTQARSEERYDRFRERRTAARSEERLD